jgi:hypothetical protein
LEGGLLTDLPTNSHVVLPALTWLERYNAVFLYWLDGHGNIHLCALVACLLIAFGWRRAFTSYWGLLPALALLLYDSVTDVAVLYTEPHRLAGLLRLAPFLVFALLPAPSRSAEAARRRREAQLIAMAFLVVAFLTTNTSGGKALGPRLLLPIWPLLAVAAWQGIRGHLGAWRAAASHQLIGSAGIALVVVGLVINTCELMPLFRSVEADTLGATRFLAAGQENTIVLGSEFAIDPVIGLYTSRAVMLASSQDDAADISKRLIAERIRSFFFVRRDDRDDLVAQLAPYGLSGEYHFGRWIIQRWSQ